MNLLEKNLLAIKLNDPELFVKLEPFFKDEITHISQLDAQVSKQRSDYLYSRFKEFNVLVVMGMCDALTLKCLLNQKDCLIKKISVVEKNPKRLLGFLATYDYQEFLNEKILKIILASESDDYRRQLNAYFRSAPMVGFIRRLAICSMGDSDLRPDDLRTYSAFELITDELVKFALVKDFVPSIDTMHGIVNLLDNWELFSSLKSISALKGIATGIAGVVVSSGPSLDRRVELLKSIQDKAVIFACDSALAILLKNGIRPHFVGALERLPEVEKFFTGLTNLQDVYLITNPLMAPNAVSAYQGPMLAAFKEMTTVQWFYPDEPSIPYGLSVANMAVQFLAFLGCKDIYLFGQDLAYDRNKDRSHADGMVFQSSASHDLNRLDEVWLEGNDDNPIKSARFWHLFLDTFNQLIMDIKVNCYNVIERNVGAKIEKASQIEPDTLTLPNIDVDLRALIANHIKGASLVKSDRQVLLNTVSQMEDYSKECYALQRDILGCFRRLQKTSDLGDLVGRVAAIFNKFKVIMSETNTINTSFLGGFILNDYMELVSHICLFADRTVKTKEEILKLINMFCDVVSKASFWTSLIKLEVEKRIT